MIELVSPCYWRRRPSPNSLTVVTFRDRLLATLRSAQPVLDVPGVLVVGSEVPNLLEHDAAASLVVSEDVDVAIPISAHREVRERLQHLDRLRPSADEPSVWVPKGDDCIELNFVGMDPALKSVREAYVLEDERLPLMVFGGLSLLRPGRIILADGVRVPVPAIAGLLVEKLATDRSGVKGDRDLLMTLGLLSEANDADLDEVARLFQTLPCEVRETVLSGLSVLSLLEPVEGMPDPRVGRPMVSLLLETLATKELPSDG